MLAQERRIQALSPRDAEVLCACTEFPSFAAALYRVAQLALPSLEREVWAARCGGAERRGKQAPALTAATYGTFPSQKVNVSASLPLFSWDITRRTTLLLDQSLVEQLLSQTERDDEVAELPPPRKAQKTHAQVSVADGERGASLDVFRRLAAITADVHVSVWLEVAVAPHRADYPTAKQGGAQSEQKREVMAIPLSTDHRWHGGHKTEARARDAPLARNAVRTHRFEASVGRLQCVLCSQCSVRGLFDSLPLRQTAFTTGRGGRGAWVASSACAQRARRDAQQQLLTVLFHAALCTVLAPLYGSHTTDNAERETAGAQQWSGFVARLFGGQQKACYTRGPRECADAVPCAAAPLPLSRLCVGDEASSYRDAVLSTPSAADGTVRGLLCDRDGLRSGCLVVSQSPRRTPLRTAGEATAEQLLCVFGVALHATAASRRKGRSPTRRTVSALGDTNGPDSIRQRCVDDASIARPRLTEVVVLPGRFAALFLERQTMVVEGASLPVRLQSTHFPFHLPTGADTLPREHEQSLSCLIVVAHQSQRSDGGPDTFASGEVPPSFAVLEAHHWAYDVVAAVARRHTRRTPRLLTAVPVVVFVDAAYVPAHLCEARSGNAQARSGVATDAGDGRQRGAVPPPTVFEQLLVEALDRCSASGSHVAVAAGGGNGRGGGQEQAGGAVCPSQTREAADTAGPTSEASPSCFARSDVSLRMGFICQQMLRAAAAPGTQSLLPPPALASAVGRTDSVDAGRSQQPSGTTRLHRVRLSPFTLLRGAHGCGTDATQAAAPRRTPVSLHPTLSAVLREERAVEAAAMGEFGIAAAGTPATVMPAGNAQRRQQRPALEKMRQLLDTGRGSVLRQLPRACDPPQSWKPSASAVARCDVASRRQLAAATHHGRLGATDHMPPIQAARLEHVAVLPWARKFILLVDGNAAEAAASGDKGNSRKQSAASTAGAASPSPLDAAITADPRDSRWWVLDQHAVHERLRLEFFLCFADTYVRHPELQFAAPTARQRRGGQTDDAARRASPRSDRWGVAAQDALQRRERNQRLLLALAQGTAAAVATHARAASPLLRPARMAQQHLQADPLTFPVVVPEDWRHRVTMVEGQLRSWGWRFQHESVTPSSSPLVTAVLAWPCIEVEGVEHHVTTLAALTDTVEELEAVGASCSAVSTSPISAIVPSVFLRFFVSRSCRGAIMFGDALKPAAALHMVEALRCVEQFYVCSHGRASFALLAPFSLCVGAKMTTKCPDGQL